MAPHSEHGGHGGHGHDMGGMVIFQNLMQTSLFSEAWTPTSTGTYAATCIFLIFLTVLFRLLLATKAILDQRWLDREWHRRYVVVADKTSFSEKLSSDSHAKHMVLSANGVEENVIVVERRTSIVRPWRLSIDPVRALIDTVIAGVGYLLMLAVMSMNVGYFLSVLGGVFLGSLTVGRFIRSEAH